MSTFFGLFNTSVMGMSAQANALANISENIANSSTVGYKKASTHFLTVLNGFQDSQTFGGGVMARSRYDVAGQGALLSTGSSTDLGIRGNGFFVVSDGSGATFLTRAGSFAPDAAGRLVNAAGYYLMGFPAGSSGNDVTGMDVVKIRTDRLYANPTTQATLSANLPAGATIIPAADLPSTNSAGAQYSAKTSVTVYDNLGTPRILDVYFAKTAANEWEIAVYDNADATSGGFPYSGGPLATQSLVFNPSNGAITAGSPVSLSLPGGASISIDMSNTTQLGAPFAVNNLVVDGNAAGAIRQVNISQNGTLSYQLDNGQLIPAYTIGLAKVASPTSLTNVSGNVYTPNGDSGPITVGTAGSGGYGLVLSSTLEASTVDLATELSSMIIAQRAFTANTQTFQVGSEILQVLNNLK